MAVAQIGRQEDGGVTRGAFTEEDREVKELVAGFMKEAGLRVYEDAAGNLIGRKEGRNPQAPAVVTGSHLDTVRNGGDFDGVLGVLGGIEVLQTMRDHGIETKHSLEVIAFTGEDGARYSGLLGSRGFTGALTEADLRQKDEQGITLAEAMEQAGYDPANLSRAVRAKETIKAYVELHIEQGKVLENAGLSVGNVEVIYGQLNDRLLFEGEGGHGGNTPMNLRKEALMAAAEVMLAAERQAKEGGFRVTMSQARAHPGGGIPRAAEFSLNLRAIDDSARDEFERQVIKRAKEICERRGVKLTVERSSRNSGAACDLSIQEVIESACGKVGLDAYSLIIGAGHDAMRVADLCPIGMILVRSKDGVSHTQEEYSSPEDCRDGTNVLYHTLLQLAQS